MNPAGPRCPRLSNEQVRACTNPVVLDVLAAVEVLGWDLTTHYRLVEHLNEVDGEYPTASDADLLAYGLTREDDDSFRRGQIDRDRRKICFAGTYAAGHYGIQQDLNDHDPEIGLWWSPSRRAKDAQVLLTTLEQDELELTVIARTRRPGLPPRFDVELVSQTDCSIQLSEPSLETALCKAAILFKRMIEAER